MLLTEKGIAFAEGFFELNNGRVINTFTGKSVGVLIRKIPSSTYLFKKKKASLFKRMLKRWKDGDSQAYTRVHEIPDESDGSLAETMRLLERK